MKHLLLFLSFCFSTHLFGQYPDTKSWDYRYGGAGHDIPYKLIETLDHGFLLCGISASYAGLEKTENCRGRYDYWVVRVDSNGVKLWDKTFGGSEYDYLTSAVALPDSGFLLGGYSMSDTSADKISPSVSGGYFDYWIVRIDKNGNRIWDRDYGGSFGGVLTDIQLLDNGNFLLAGYSSSDSSFNFTHHSYGGNDIWIICIDPLGNILWDKNYGGMDHEGDCKVIVTPDNGYLISCTSNSLANGSINFPTCHGINTDIYVVKLDSSGNQQWDRMIGGNIADQSFGLVKYSDNKFIIGGISNSDSSCKKSQDAFYPGRRDFWSVCVDSIGGITWDKTLGGLEDEDDFGSITNTTDGILMCGTSYSDSSGNKHSHNIFNTEQPWLVTVDSLGNVVWDKAIENPSHPEYCYGLQTENGCYVVLSSATTGGGDVTVNRFSGVDFWLVKYCSSNIPLAAFTTNTTVFCQNSCVAFTNHSRNATTSSWLFPGATPATSSQVNPSNICYQNSGTYDVTLIVTNSISGTSDTLLMPGTITVNPSPQMQPLYASGDTVFSTPGFLSYQWFFNSSVIPQAHNYFCRAFWDGNYTVNVIDSNGCQAAATLLGLQTGIHSIDINTPSAFYSNGKLMLNSLPNYKYVLKIFDVSGKEIFRKKIPGNQIDIGPLPTGVFFVLMESSEESFRLKLLVTE